MSKEIDSYRKNYVYSATKSGLLIILYNEIIKNLNQIKGFLELNDYESAIKTAKRTEKIFNYLIQTLDFNYEISYDLYELYIFINKQMFRAVQINSVKEIDELSPLVKDLRDTWKEADKIARQSNR